MKKFTLKGISFALVLVLVIGVFAGCGSQTENSGQTENSINNENSLLNDSGKVSNDSLSSDFDSWTYVNTLDKKS